MTLDVAREREAQYEVEERDNCIEEPVRITLMIVRGVGGWPVAVEPAIDDLLEPGNGQHLLRSVSVVEVR